MLSRRRFLLAATAACGLGLAGCDLGSPEPPAQTSAGPTNSPVQPTIPQPTPIATDDDGLRQDVAQSESELITAYQLALAAHPELTDQLGPFLAAHQEHLARVAPPEPPTVAPTASTSPKKASAAKARRRLARLEEAAADQRALAADVASDPELTALLALICASEAQHAEVLTTSGGADQ